MAMDKLKVTQSLLYYTGKQFLTSFIFTSIFQLFRTILSMLISKLQLVFLCQIVLFTAYLIAITIVIGVATWRW